MWNSNLPRYPVFLYLLVTVDVESHHPPWAPLGWCPPGGPDCSQPFLGISSLGTSEHIGASGAPYTLLSASTRLLCLKPKLETCGMLQGHDARSVTSCRFASAMGVKVLCEEFGAVHTGFNTNVSRWIFSEWRLWQFPNHRAPVLSNISFNFMSLSLTQGSPKSTLSFLRLHNPLSRPATPTETPAWLMAPPYRQKSPSWLFTDVCFFPHQICLSNKVPFTNNTLI